MTDRNRSISPPSRLKQWGVKFASYLVTGFARFVTAMRPIGVEAHAGRTPVVYFSNHTSNGDFVLIWTAFPPKERRSIRPVAGSDYWDQTAIKRFMGRDVFNAVLIDRNPETRTQDPVAQMTQALTQGDNLIIFPEGTRNTTSEPLLAFKPGIFHLAQNCPDTEFVPVWIENLNRVMPKGEVVPVPIMCTVTFGAPLKLSADDDKASFLERSRNALLALCPNSHKTAETQTPPRTGAAP